MIHEQRKYMKTVAYKDYKFLEEGDTFKYVLRVYFCKSFWKGRYCTYSRPEVKLDVVSIDESDWKLLSRLPEGVIEVDSKYTDIPPI